MELIDPELPYLRRFRAETANSPFGPGTVFKACWGYIDDLVFQSIPKAQWEIDWDSSPIPLPPEVPFPSLGVARRPPPEGRRRQERRAVARKSTRKNSLPEHVV